MRAIARYAKHDNTTKCSHSTNNEVLPNVVDLTDYSFRVISKLVNNFSMADSD